MWYISRMANIKSVQICGEMPFDACDNDALLRWLGRLSLPSIGIKVTWKGQRYIPSKWGGETCMHPCPRHHCGLLIRAARIRTYEIVGEEAFRWDSLRNLIALLRQVGNVNHAKAWDIEEGGGIDFLTNERFELIGGFKGGL